MNDENQAPTGYAAGANRFVLWIGAVAKKIAAVFTKPKKEKEKFAFSTIAEGISFVEWRTWYDQKRIVQAIKTIAAIKAYPQLCEALDIKYPVSQKVSAIVLTENSGFDRRMIELFGFERLHPQTQSLLLGGETKAQKLPRTSEFEKMFLANIGNIGKPQATNSCEAWLLREFALELNAIQAIEEPAIEQPALATVPVEVELPEVAIDIEVIDIEIVSQGNKSSKSIAKEKSKKLSRKMTIKQLKAYAADCGIRVPGKVTKHREIYEYIKSKSRL